MKVLKNIYMWLAVGCLSVVGLSTTSCKDDIAAESYFTFTGEMMSDYLQSHSEYSEFAEIINRAKNSQRGVNLMDLISTYGQYTCFAPNNDAVDAFLKENGYASVSDIPADICDTIARTHLVSGRMYNTTDFAGTTSLPSVNMNERYLQIQEAFQYDENKYTTDTLEVEGKEDIKPTHRFNRSGYVIPELANDSVENGIIQPINAVLSSSNATVVDLMEENEKISLFCQAMDAVGISQYIKGRIKDAKWDPDKYEVQHVYTGSQIDYCHLPDTKNYGYTVFACPTDVLQSKYGITDLQTFYDYAKSIYGGEDLDVNDPANADKLKDWRSPLRRLIGYNILNCKGLYDNLTTICTIETTLVNPTEWYSTLDSLTTIKIDRLTVSRYIGKGENDKRNDLYLNRGDMSRGYFTLPGVHVEREVEGYTNEGLNGVYYLTDGLADFGEVTKRDVFNTRLRTDLYYLFPELMTNNIRDGRTNNKIADSDNGDKTVTSPNYWFPNGYLDNVKVNDDGVFLFQSQHNTYWSYQGDEFNLTSATNYDITFNLPSVPSGTYQIRLGFCAMGSRGICQFYLDGESQGIPFDMRNTNFVDRTGWFALTNGSYTTNTEEWEQAKKNMHNLGWYHGPRSVFNFTTEGTKDGANAAKSYFCNNGGGGYTVRYVLCTATLDENKQHTIRIRKVWGDENCVAMLDYIELVPKSVYGVEGEGKAEDDY